MEGKRRTGGMNRFSGISPVFLFFYPPPNPLPFLSFLFLSASKKNSGTGSGLVCPKQSSVWFASFGPDSSFFPLPTLSPSFLLSLSLSLSDYSVLLTLWFLFSFLSLLNILSLPSLLVGLSCRSPRYSLLIFLPPPILFFLYLEAFQPRTFETLRFIARTLRRTGILDNIPFSSLQIPFCALNRCSLTRLRLRR